MTSRKLGRARKRVSVASRIRIGVFGAGRVGATIAAAWIRKGASVTIADIDKVRIERLKAGQPLFGDEPGVDDAIQGALMNGRCRVTSETALAANGCGCIFIAVPAGLQGVRADLSAVRSASRDVGASMTRGALVILETSVPPGTTREVVTPELEKASGMRAGRDFYVAYSPERIFEGRALKDLEENYVKVVAGLDSKSLDLASSFYSEVAKKGVLKMRSLESAEAEKLFEGIYRDVNIALANELSNYCEARNIDFWEVQTAANSQPFCHLHKPGLGVGGACIPVYPRFVLEDSKALGVPLQLVETARQVNAGRPERMATMILGNSSLQKGARIAILGLAFRGDVSDDRLSPSYDLIRAIKGKGFDLVAHDPFVHPLRTDGFRMAGSVEEAVKGAQLIVVATDHSAYRKLSFGGLQKLAGGDPVIFDARGVLAGAGGDSTNWRMVGTGKSARRVS